MVCPILYFSQRDLISIGDGVWFNVIDYPIDPKLVGKVSRALTKIFGSNIGYFVWHVMKGISSALFCCYVDRWNDEVIREILIKKLLEA